MKIRASMTKSIAAAVHKVDPDVALATPRTMEQVRHDVLSDDRFTLVLFACFAAIALSTGRPRHLWRHDISVAQRAMRLHCAWRWARHGARSDAGPARRRDAGGGGICPWVGRCILHWPRHAEHALWRERARPVRVFSRGVVLLVALLWWPVSCRPIARLPLSRCACCARSKQVPQRMPTALARTVV